MILAVLFIPVLVITLAIHLSSGTRMAFEAADTQYGAPLTYPWVPEDPKRGCTPSAP